MYVIFLVQIQNKVSHNYMLGTMFFLNIFQQKCVMGHICVIQPTFFLCYMILELHFFHNWKVYELICYWVQTKEALITTHREI